VDLFGSACNFLACHLIFAVARLVFGNIPMLESQITYLLCAFAASSNVLDDQSTVHNVLLQFTAGCIRSRMQ